MNHTFVYMAIATYIDRVLKKVITLLNDYAKIIMVEEPDKVIIVSIMGVVYPLAMYVVIMTMSHDRFC